MGEDKVSRRSADLLRLRYTQKRVRARRWKCDRHLIGTRYLGNEGYKLFRFLSAPYPPPFPPPSFHVSRAGATPRVETRRQEGMKNCYLIYGHEIRPRRNVSRH